MKSLFKFSFFILIIAASLVSCKKQEREAAIAQDEKEIESYIQGKQQDTVVFNNGVYRVVLTHGAKENPVLEQLDTVSFFYSIYEFKNGPGKLYASNKPSVVQANNFPPDTLPKRMCLKKGDIINGIYYGMVGMKEGEVSNLVFSSKLGYGNKCVYNIPKNTPLFVEICIDKIVK